MAGTHNFKVFDETQANMTPDTSYAADTARLAGAQPNSVADPLSANKAWHQATIMAAAIAQYIANQGISTDDTNLSNLVSALAGSIASLSGISYADRTAHGLLGTADIGQISYCAAQPTPAAATYAASGTGNLNGAYRYREVLISGYKNADGTYSVRGFSPAASRSTADVAPSSQQVLITNLPVGTAGCIGRAIYRSAAGGSAGSEQFCGIIWDNTTTTYTDNLVDSQLGAGTPTVQGTAIPAAVPTANTTGTTNASSVPVARTINGYDLSANRTLAAVDVKAIGIATTFIASGGAILDWANGLTGCGEIGQVQPNYASDAPEAHEGLYICENVGNASRKIVTFKSFYTYGMVYQRRIFNAAWNGGWYIVGQGSAAATAATSDNSVAIGTPGLRNAQASSAQASSYLGLGVINVVIS